MVSLNFSLLSTLQSSLWEIECEVKQDRERERGEESKGEKRGIFNKTKKKRKSK